MLHTVARLVSLFVVLILSPVEFGRAAAADPEVPAITLRYRSADLDSAHGIAILYRRIQSAASSVCGVYDSVLLEEKVQWDECVDQAVGKAVAAVHSETLSAYHGRRFRSFALEHVPDARSSTKR